MLTGSILTLKLGILLILDMKVCIGIAVAGHSFPAETLEALMNMKVPPQIFTKVIAGESVAKARNALVKIALENNATHLLFVDDDNPPPQNTLEKLLQADKDIICAPILSRHTPFVPCIFTKEQIPNNTLPGYKHIDKVDTTGGEVVKIDACGMACTLIKREVLEKLWKEYEGEPFVFSRDEITPTNGKTRREMSEDVTFCERATNEGFEIWCDTTIRPIHLAGYKYVQFNDSMIL